MILLDTNVVSGLIRAAAEPRLLEWFLRQTDNTPLVSTVVIAEIEFGLARLPAGRRARDLRLAFTSLVDGMMIIDFNQEMAVACAAFRAARERSGRPLGFADAMIAATASVASADVITRNVRDFQGLGLTLIDPWSA